MKLRRSIWLSAVLVVLGAAAVRPAMAQSTWNIYNGSYQGSGCSASGSTFGNEWSCTGAAGSMSVSGWSTATGSGSTQQTFTPGGSYYANAYLSDQGNSGVGVTNRADGSGSPAHSIDNIPNGTFDGVLLNFGSASNTVLSSVGIGWASLNGTSSGGGAADITVLRWVGSGSPEGTNSTSTSVGSKDTLNQSGWQLVGSYFGLTADASTPFGGTARGTNAALTSTSSWWLITAFNSTLNGSSTACWKSSDTAQTGPTGVCTDGNDGFKLNYVQTKVGTTTQPGSGVPEPASLALVALALVGSIGASRRKPAVKA